MTKFTIEHVALFFLPRPLPAGEVLLAQVCIRLRGNDGTPGVGWGMTPLCVLDCQDRTHELTLRHCCEELAEAWRGLSCDGHSALLDEQFRQQVLPAFGQNFASIKGEDLAQDDILVCLSPFTTALHEAYTALWGLPEDWRPGAG